MIGLLSRSNNLNTVVDRLFYTVPGSMIFSGIIGFALAMLFSRVCKDKKCLIIRAPPDIKDNIYGLDENCYTYTPVPTKCDNQDNPIQSSTNSALA